MKIFVLVLIFVACTSANCGCLKCSPHLQGVDIPGPNGCPVKVIFKKPEMNCGCPTAGSYTPIVQAPVVVPTSLPSPPGKTYNYKLQYFCKPCLRRCDDCGGQEYSAVVQTPVPSLPKVPLPLLSNLKYRTDTVLVPSPKCIEPPAPTPAESPELISLLKKLQAVATSSLTPAASTGPIFERVHCCQCDRLENTFELTSNIKSNNNRRDKRDLTKHGYNFLMNMLPQSLRAPLHHSIQGVYVAPSKPKLNWRQKLAELKTKKVIGYGNNRPQARHLLPKLAQLPRHFASNIEEGNENGYLGFENFWEQQPEQTYYKYPWQKNAVLEPPSEKNLFKNLKYSFLDDNHSKSLTPALSQKQQDSKFKSFAQKYSSPSSSLLSIPKLFSRVNEPRDDDEAGLLKKLKKLNNNPFSSNIEDQATVFMKELLQPHKRTRRSAVARQKRTIILGSDEIDLPPHYEVDFVSVEDEEPENLKYSDESSEESPTVGLRKPPAAPSRHFFSRLPIYQPKPETVLGKNVIQKAVREELETYHRKLEKEQKIRDMKANWQMQQQRSSLIPQNPIFMLLTAPMKFLKHFHDINKGVSPVMATLPKLVYTTKKYFRDFGKNFQKNCLNLASDIIGDFDHIQPSVIQQITNTKGGRHRREASKNSEDDFRPDYSMIFKNSKESENFHRGPHDHVRKKRYVIKVVDDDEVQDQVQDYLTQKLDDQLSYLKPLQDYYNKVNDFLTKLYSGQKEEDFFYDSPREEQQEDSAEDFTDVKPKKRIIQIKKIKPRVIIDNKGLPFMEYDGYKRPLLLNGKKYGLLRKSPVEQHMSSEETGNKIAKLIARAKEDSAVVGSSHNDIVPRQIVKERISSLLKEIDQLVQLNPENYDAIFEDLIKIQHIKTSIEQDWKRLLIDDRVDDKDAKIGLLSKFDDLQQAKDESMKNIIEVLAKNDNEFVRRQLVHSLIKLQKLQCLITSVVDDFEQHLNMRTSFNTKKEIKYVDFLSEIKFVYSKTRNDLVKMLRQDRDAEGQKNLDLLQKLKKLLISSENAPDKFDRAAKLIWEMENLEKLQTQTIQDMRKKLSRNYKIRKELRILFDLQKRFEDCEAELNELLGGSIVKATIHKKDIKEIIANIKAKHEETLRKAKERANGFQRLKNT